MSAISFSDELDVTSLLQIIIDVQHIYNENKLFFDLFSELIMHMPSTINKIKAKFNDTFLDVEVQHYYHNKFKTFVIFVDVGCYSIGNSAR